MGMSRFVNEHWSRAREDATPRPMGTGTITLWWYALCCAFVVVSVIATSVLVALGQRKRRRARLPQDPKREPPQER